MNNAFHPQFPIYIISKGRWESRLTVRALEIMNQDFFIVVEQQEYKQYAAVISPEKILVLDARYQEQYDTCEVGPPSPTKGSGPARNFCWDHAVKNGHTHHWLMDDNIRCFYRYHAGQQLVVTNSAIFRAMEDFTLKYDNVALSGPNYWLAVARKQQYRPFAVNTRIFSCLLIRNDLPLRWRARYNEDADLSIRAMKLGYCTIQFYAFLQGKVPTQTMKGGNTDTLYAGGTKEKSEMLRRLHPDCVTLVHKFSRHHHAINYAQFTQTLMPAKTPLPIKGEYGMSLKQLQEIKSPELQRWYEKHKKK